MLAINNIVSIIIPVYNRSGLIGEAINSILKQSYSKWEILVVDDVSTDDTLKIVNEFVAKDTRIKVFQRDRGPKGAPVCRNIGLSLAQGKYLIFLDSDDLLAPWCLKTRVQAFENDPEFDFMVFYGAFFTNSINDASILWNRFDARDDLKRFLGGEPVWQTSAPIWKTSYLKNTRHTFDETVMSSQDWEFHVRALLQSPIYKKFDCLPDYFIRRTPGLDRISEGHWSESKILKRVLMYEHVITNQLLNSTNEKYGFNLLIVIFKQYHYLLNVSSKTFVADHLVTLTSKMGNIPLKMRMGFVYLVTGNKLLRIHPYLFKCFRKICEIIFLKKLFTNYSKYRSGMFDHEIRSLQIKLHSN